MKNVTLNRTLARRRDGGQTLIMALFVLGILLIVGFVFIGVVNQNLIRQGVAQQRSVASDLAEAGIRFAHNQLLYSAQGADFRLTPSGPLSNRDPDFDFLRLDADPTPGDQGGPDQLGSYTRVNFANGRALVRVRYAPSDTILWTTNPPGSLRQPTKARSYLIIESVGKVGTINPNDPTTVLGAERRENRKLVAFCSIGMLESARFFTNKDRVNRPAEIGIPSNFGGRYVDDTSANAGGEVVLPQIIGSELPMWDFGNPPTPSANAIPTGGSIHANSDLAIFGTVVANLNYTLGEGISAAGNIYGADENAALMIRRAQWNGATWDVVNTTVQNTTNPSLDSRRGNFSTIFGVLRDEFAGTDAEGWVRSMQYKSPPSMQTADPVSGRTRFWEITRNSGWLGPAGNTGRFGHGQGVYVNNSQDRQMRGDEAGREDVGTAESLVYDWFNPNNGQANSGWQGYYYIPRGAMVQLMSDGFLIRRDARAEGNERTWRRPDGINTGSSEIRYRIGPGPNAVPFIINSFTPGVDINAANPNYSLGQPFNGVLLFDGNVRVRGVIPTDIQLTLVSNATIYIEGSITKGVVGNDWTQFSSGIGAFQRLNRPSLSMLMLMAKDYVAVNTTMFFGPPPGQAIQEVSESPGAVAWNPLRMQVGGGTFTLRWEELLDPQAAGSNALDPSTWHPYSFGSGGQNGYREYPADSEFIDPALVLSHAMDDGPAPFTFVSLDVNFGIGSALNPSAYLFPMGPLNPFNSATGQGPYVSPYTTPGYGTADYIPILGLGSESWQRYPKFESVGFPLVSFAGTTINFPTLDLNAPQGKYRLLLQETNDLTFRHNNVGAGATNDWLLARTAKMPHDVRIEAAVFAEEGSFVVIPGNWFNPNPNDSRQAYETRVAAVGRAAADQERRENFGANPQMPFYGEPIDVRFTLLGSITENMPLPISQQAEWLRKWAWIPRRMAARTNGSGQPLQIPTKHVPIGYTMDNNFPYAPNLYVVYDPALSTGRTSGYDLPVGTDSSRYIRRDPFGRPLPPMPRLPVSPALSYFGEVQP